MLLRENILKKKAQFRQEIKSERNSILFGLKRAQYQSISQNPDQITFKDLLNNIKTLNVELFMNYIIDLKNQLSIYEWNSDKLLEMKKEGVLEYLIYMFRESKDRLQLDLAYILSNTLTGDSKITEYCIEKGLLDIFIELLKKNDFLIREQVLWGLANIAGDTEDILCLFFEKNVISQIKKTVFTFENTIEIRKTGSWLISNILRAKENIIGMKKGLNYEDLCSIIEILEKWLIEGDLDYENLENTLFCLNSIAKRFIHKTLITNIIQNHSSLIQKLNIIFQKTQKDQYIIHYLNFIGSLLTDNEDSETEVYFYNFFIIFIL